MANTQVSLVGNLTRPPELRYSATGTPVVKFGIAVNEKYNDKETTSFFDVTAWQQLAENVSECLDKGHRAMVIGRLQQDTWERDGERRSRVEVVANAVGPDLLWATCEMAKKSGVSENTVGSHGSSYATAGGGGGGGASRNRPAPPAYEADEEPF